mmetsp:Transcript_62237/g.143298  ORF Transcript_62237/g.143298 Transcript_62237/m.143298 type:complete len:210 (+) Transcript_62237:182-811(+)
MQSLHGPESQNFQTAALASAAAAAAAQVPPSPAAPCAAAAPAASHRPWPGGSAGGRPLAAGWSPPPPRIPLDGPQSSPVGLWAHPTPAPAAGAAAAADAPAAGGRARERSLCATTRRYWARRGAGGILRILGGSSSSARLPAPPWFATEVGSAPKSSASYLSGWRGSVTASGFRLVPWSPHPGLPAPVVACAGICRPPTEQRICPRPSG